MYNLFEWIYVSRFLDPAHSYTGPGIASQTALKMTNVELALLAAVDAHLFIIHFWLYLWSYFHVFITIVIYQTEFEL